MKAIFMTEVGGKLLEIDRRDIKETEVYYCAVSEPVQMRAIADPELTLPPVMVGSGYVWLEWVWRRRRSQFLEVWWDYSLGDKAWWDAK